jgi:hypothetical protein
VRVARVFPTRTNATPRDPLAFSPRPGKDYRDAAPPLPGMAPKVDAVHISAVFTWDLPGAYWLAEEWDRVAPVTIGGPATGMRGEDFTPGMYVREGYVITSRGCPNRCWFCSVPKREGNIRELPITEGWNVLDDNLLACSEKHITAVFDMLKRQKMGRPQFTGGLEAARLTPDLALSLREVKPKQLFFAYDTPDDYAPLVQAVELCWHAGFTPASHALRCYVLCGWPKDTLAEADKRMRAVLSLGVLPMAMPWRDRQGVVSLEWSRFARRWTRCHIVGTKLREVA